MSSRKERPLSHRLYFDPVYTEVARIIGYAGCVYRDLEDKLQPLYERFDKQRVQSATYYLVTFEGQMTCNPPPLAPVQLRAEARALCRQLLGLPPEHPWYARFKSGKPLPLPWDKATEKPPQLEETVSRPPGKAAAEMPSDPEAERLKKLNKRQLLCHLRDVRRSLEQNGADSLVGKEAKKRIAVAEEELKRRGLPIPAPGEEVPVKKQDPSPKQEPEQKGEAS